MSVLSINGSIIEDTRKSIDILDLGFNRGHSVFEYFRFKNSEPRFLSEHLSRLSNSASFSNIELKVSVSDLTEMIIDVIKQSKFSEGSIRLTVSAGSSSNFSTPETKASIYILSSQFKSLPEDLYISGAKLVTKKHSREFPSIKSTNYFFAQMHRKEMLDAGAIDILYYDEYIRETSRANIFLIVDKEIYTPKNKILEGITRKNVLSLNLGIQEIDIEPKFINQVDEIFITSSSREIMPIVKVDDIKIGKGKVGQITKSIIMKYNNLINNKV